MERRLTPEELLAHARWMRPLARSLVHDAHAADDVVQESLVAALRRPPDARLPLEPWLSRVVKNVAANFRRGEQRLAERHARGVERDASAGAADPLASLERLDTQRLLVDLVRELDEPLRTAIVLAYFEGLTSVEIGRRLGTSDATVRWRIQRGLAVLRARLEQKHGSREAWCTVLAPFAGPLTTLGPVAAGSGAAAGAIAMGSAVKVLFAAAVLSAVGAGVWLTREAHEPLPVTPAVSAAPPRAPAEEAGTEPVAPVAPEREALSPGVARAPESPESAEKPAAAAPESPGEPARVKARFVDASGQPWDRVHFREAQDGDPSSTSGPDGRAELLVTLDAGSRDPSLQFAASRAGCATRAMRSTLSPGGTVDLGEVVLEREARVRGVVRDELGQGLADVTVGLSTVDLEAELSSTGTEDAEAGRLRRHGSQGFDKLIVARSDARGAFDLAGVPAGSWRLYGKGDERGYGVSAPFEVQPGEEELGVDFVVPALLATDSISGVVLDPAGTPVAGANVMLSYEVEHESGTTSETSKPDGTFRFLLHLETASDLVASDKDQRWVEAALTGVPPGARDLVLQLGDPSAQPKARVRVRGPADEPVRAITLNSRSGRKNSYSETRLATVEVDPGVHEFQVPAAAFGLTVEAEGYLPSELIEIEPASLSGELPVRLEAAPVLVGSVRAGGKPLAGAVVEAQRAITSYHLTFNDFPCLMSPHADAHAESGAEGLFRLVLEGRQPVYLRCTAPGYAPTVVGPIRVDAPGAPIDVELGAGGSIEGRVKSKDGTTVVGAIVGITNGDGHPRTMRSGHDGLFRFDGLAVGSWVVLERDQEFRTDVTTLRSTDGAQAITWSCEVTEGRTTYHDLVLE